MSTSPRAPRNDDDDDDDDKASRSPVSSPSASSKPPKSAKKRTKTGCLTCRKRRIKCKEEKPYCSNCVKSRRQCEYTKFQWRPPGPGMYAAPNGPVGNDLFPPGPMPIFMGPQSPPLPYGAHPAMSMGQQPQLPPNPNSMTPSFANSFAWPPPSDASDWPSAPSQQLPFFSPSDQRFPFDTRHPPPLQPAVPDSKLHMDPASYSGASPPFLPAAGSSFMSPMSFTAHHGSSNLWATSTGSSSAMPDPPPLVPQRTDYEVHQGTTFPDAALQMSSRSSMANPMATASRNGLYGLYSTQILEQAAVELQDDDYYDVISEDSEHSALAATTRPSPTAQLQDSRTAGLQLEPRGLHRPSAFSRGHTSTGHVDQYRAERVASPLRNEATAHVFAHFITATAPLLSCYERPLEDPTRPASVSTNIFLPDSTQNIWTSTLPTRALHHQGLLHAMLAMSSLHIARLDKASITPSYKHYAWAIKKIHHQVGKRDGQNRVEVLAATLMLSFFEVMSASMHQWLPHLGGAGQLLAEIDFPGMARKLQRLKTSTASNHPPRLQTALRQFTVVNHRNLDIVSGVQRPVDELGFPIEIEPWRGARNRAPIADELELFGTFQDLFWWYAKCDVIFSILSGDFTLMPFAQWTRCPPRADLGDRTRMYGNFDWVILLLGRVCNFAAHDLQRKIRHNEITGSPYPPMPFHGLAPSVSRSCPAVYGSSISGQTPTRQEIRNADELKEATQKAMAEWDAIRKATDMIEKKLEDAFPRTPSEDVAELKCPFGQPITYAADNIGLLILHVKLARLQLLRAHPFMPPSMAQAIPAAASQTAPLVLEMGRLICGIAPQLSPAAALIPAIAGAHADITIPLYAAGMQYTEASHRSWLLGRLKDLEASSGNASLGLCCMGLERYWEGMDRRRALQSAQRQPRRHERDDLMAQTSRLESLMERERRRATAVLAERPSITMIPPGV